MLSKVNYTKQEPIFQIQGGHFDINLVRLKHFLHHFLSNRWLDVLLLLLVGYVFLSGKINISFAQNTNYQPENPIVEQQLNSLISEKQKKQRAKVASNPSDNNRAMAAALPIVSPEKLEHDPDNDGVVELLPMRQSRPELVSPAMLLPNDNAANHFQNISAITNNDKATPSVSSPKQAKCLHYVSRFINVAKVEKAKFGIPVSIILAQGLLESDAGESRLTRKANNHFGIKTFNPSVPHVVLKDDTPKDKFKKYNSAWQSYRDHSLLLMRNHYKHLQFLSKTDYVGWAKGLQQAGYATDKQYAKKLVRIIEELKLYRFDEV